MLNSKFSPSQTIGRSPVITKKSIFNQNEGKKMISPFINNPNLRKKDAVVEEKEEEKNKVNVNRKTRNLFKNIENIEKNPKFADKNKDEDLPITMGVQTSGDKHDFL